MPLLRFGNNSFARYTRSGITDQQIDNSLAERMIYSDGGRSQLTSFNRFRYFERNDTLPGTKEFIFFTRPDCFIFENGKLRQDAYRIPFFEDAVNRPVAASDIVIKDLQIRGMSHKSAFYPLLSNRATGYTPVDDELDSVEVGDTWHGNKVVYGRHNLKSRTAGTASFTFVDNAGLHVLKALKGLNEYIEAVSLGSLNPRESDIFDGVLDYPMSMYYIVTELDGETIIYWEKMVGLFPINVPNSIFDMKENDMNGRDLIYNIQMRYTARSKSLDPYILYELNQLTANERITASSSKISPNDTWNSLYGYRGNGKNLVDYPVVVKNSSAQGQKANEYRLLWVGDKLGGNIV